MLTSGVKKKCMDHESKKSGFRFDLKYPFRVWILWIYDPFLDSRIRILEFPQKPIQTADCGLRTADC